MTTKNTPNLLFLFTDEQRYDTLSVYGNSRIEMPNLNRLAERSCVFDRAYVTQSLCTPSRSTLMTGLYPHTNGCRKNNIPLPPDTPCLPEMLPAGGYATGYHGKWHLGDEIFAQHGFEDWASIEDLYSKHYSEGRDPDAKSSYHHWLIERGRQPEDGNVFNRGETARMPEELSKPAYLAEEACRFLRANRDNPFVLCVNFLEPHMPFFGPRDDQYDPAEVTLPPNFDCPPTEDQPLKTRLIERHYRHVGADGLPLDSEADWRRLIANYWGLCSLVDTHVGTILSTLEDCGLDDNTIIVYTSDHGDMMGSHRLVAKGVMFEEAIRVPMMVRLPGQRDPRRIEGPVSQVDVVPTLLDLMGVRPPEHLEGRSLRPELEGRRERTGRDVVVEWNEKESVIRGLRQGALPEHLQDVTNAEQGLAAVSDEVRTLLSQDGWKLNVSPTLGEHELYDLNVDPGETTNLAGQGEHRPRMRRMLASLRQWQQETNDTVELPDF